MRYPLTRRLVAPPVRVDVDRDNDIDETDAQRLADGAIFRFWCDDDTGKGDYIGQWTDVRSNWETALVGLLTWCNVVWYNSAP